jgi:hypothetical protein
MMTQDLHIVVAAIESQGQFVGWTAVTAPMTWPDAQKLWDEMDQDLRKGYGTMIGTSRRRNGGHVSRYAVRSVADPRFAPLVGHGYADARTRAGYRGTQTGDEKAARAWAKLHGYAGNRGGWIYPPTGNKPVCQGWWSFAQDLRRNKAIARGADGLWYVLDRALVS